MSRIMPPFLLRIRDNASTLWAMRNPRERSTLAVGSVLLLLSLIWLWLIDPALQGRTQWDKKLPVMRAELAQMQSLARELGAESEIKSVVALPLSRSTLEASLSAKNLKPQTIVITNEFVKLSFSDVPFSALTAWLSERQTGAQLSVTEATITARDQSDKVDATLSLRQIAP
jgi:general secretion pathway protein M